MIYRFGNCVLDTETFELRRNGTTVEVEPQVFGVLRYLIENRDRVVSKDELVNAVWAGRIVSDATISSRISAARTAVDDTGRAQAVIRTLPRRGFRFVATLDNGSDEAPDRRPTAAITTSPTKGNAARRPSDPLPAGASRQRIHLCTSADRTRLAYATTGEGYPLVRAGHWLTHLDFDWHSPIWRPILLELGKNFRVTRYDQRGNGLSDWVVNDFSLHRCIEDLEAVVKAAGLDRFALYGSSQGAPIAIAYAARHPERVSHLILHGGYIQGRLIRGSKEEREQGQALLTLIRHGWGKPESPFLKAFTSMYIPDGTREEIESLVELQQKATSSENAARLRAAIDCFDVAHFLPEITVPTLVVHARNDGVQPLDQGRALAAAIKNAEFLMLESSNHVVVQSEPAWDEFFRALRNFVIDD